MSQLVLSLTIGGQSLWAFSTTTEDVTIRNHLYQRLGPSEALRRLARRFPGGSAKAEVERRRRQVEDRSDSDDEVVNVILEFCPGDCSFSGPGLGRRLRLRFHQRHDFCGQI